VMIIKQSKFQLEFKGTSINFNLNCQLNHLQKARPHRLL
jgi:hypothetical protein